METNEVSIKDKNENDSGGHGGCSGPFPEYDDTPVTEMDDDQR